LINKFLKGLSHQIFGGLFWPTWIGLERKGTSTGFYIFLLLLTFLEAILKFLRIQYQNISEIPGISEMDLQMWAAVLGDFLLPSGRTARKV